MKLDKEQKKILAAALRRKQILQRNLCIDPYAVESRPSKPQEAVLKDVDHQHVYVVAGNQSGKSQIGGRIVAWKFTETHPHWKRRPEWGDEPLFMIVAGRLGHQVEELWQKKIMPFLPKGSFREVRQSTVLQKVIHKENGNTILFTSHDKANQAWEKIQSFVAHHVWIDEMPSHAKYLEEAHVRVYARRGQCVATFTPKSRNEKIRKMIDNADPDIAATYRMGMLDNPIYWGREEEVLKSVAHLDEEDRNATLHGEWVSGDSTVFNYSRDRHCSKLPSTYSTSWSHVLAFDPAASGLGGLVIVAQDPNSKFWHVVFAKYVEGKAPSVLVEEVRRIAAPYNVVRKIYDTHESWFHAEACQQGYHGWIAVDKHQRKKELITGLKQALLDMWLKFVPGMTKLEEEFRNAEWSDADECKIRNSSKYHLLDAMQYLIDNLPGFIAPAETLSRDAAIKKAHMETMIQESKAKKQAKEQKRTGRKKYQINNPSKRWERKLW